MEWKINMEKDLITINNIRILMKNIDLLQTLAIQYQSSYSKLKLTEQTIEQYNQQLIKEKEHHNHNLILYLGMKEQKETYFCPICENYLINPKLDQIKDKKIIDVSSLISKSLSEQDIASYVRKVIFRYHKIYTKLIIEDIYQYLQSNLKDDAKVKQIKKV